MPYVAKKKLVCITKMNEMCITKMNEMCMTKMKEICMTRMNKMCTGRINGGAQWCSAPLAYFGEIVVQALKLSYILYT